MAEDLTRSSTRVRIEHLVDALTRLEAKTDKVVDELGALSREIVGLRITVEHIGAEQAQAEADLKSLERRVGKLETTAAMTPRQSTALAGGVGTLAGAAVAALARWLGL